MEKDKIKRFERNFYSKIIANNYQSRERSTKYKGYFMMRWLLFFLNNHLLNKTKYFAIGPNAFIKDDDVEYDILIIDKNAKSGLIVPKKYVKYVLECKTSGGYEAKEIINSFKIFKRKYRSRINYIYFAIYVSLSHLVEFQKKGINAFGIKKFSPNKSGVYESLPELNFEEFINFLEKTVKRNNT